MIPIPIPRYALGVDLGSASVKLVVLDDRGGIVHEAYALHNGDVLGAYHRLLAGACRHFPAGRIAHSGACGAFSRLLEAAGAHHVDEVAALSEGVLHRHPHAACVMDIGGQSAKFLSGLRKGESPGHFAMNSNCAAGTGAFFEDQMSRLNLPLEEYSHIAGAALAVPRIAGRCSVFAKTDIIHHQQEGAAVQDILLGLAYAVVRNYRAAIVKKAPVPAPVVLAGGTAYNTALVKAVREVFTLGEGELIVDPAPAGMAALGAALHAMRNGAPSGLPRVGTATPGAAKNGAVHLPPLPRDIPDTSAMHGCAPVAGPAKCALGIDVGSTSTNLVLLDESGRVVDCQYLRTRGNPERAVRDGLASIQRRLGQSVVVKAVGTTGSGRHLIGKLVGADAIRDEITAQAAAALADDPAVDTIFEIGGQDSKYIHCRDGRVDDFQMNKICAAGTGSFLEEQAARLGIPLEEIGLRALAAPSPVDLGERCTVFIETNISSCLADGAGKDDLAAGLCLSVVRNYLTKVVGNKPVGDRIRLQGGVAFNPGIVAAFRQTFGTRLEVTPFFGVTGAVGAALLAGQAVGNGKTSFAGFELERRTEEISSRAAAIERNVESYAKSGALLTKGYSGVVETGRKTIGIPRVLLIHRLFPLFHHFFRRLGYNVLLSDPTGETTIRDSQDTARDETCYPVKLIHGHMLELVNRGVDYIFMPRLHTIRHETSMVRHNYGCVYMQTAPGLIAGALDLEKRGVTLLDPVLSLDLGLKEMPRALIGVGRRLGHSNGKCFAAVMAGAAALWRFTREVEKIGGEVLGSLGRDEIALVLITRNYGLADPALNLGIARIVLGMGYKVLTLPHLPVHDMDLREEYPNLYWPFGQHILAGAKLVRQHPNLYAIYLTSHGCGPDAMLSHLFRQEMGDKPFLAIEVDEHDSKVGVITRVEAFINSIKGTHGPGVVAKPVHEYAASAPHSRVAMRTSLAEVKRREELAIPWLYPFSRLICASLRAQGCAARVLPATSAESMAAGRAKTGSKEYLSFTALLGNVIAHAQKNPRACFLLPQTEGAEADGHYARVIRGILDESGFPEAGVVSPMLERLWEDSGSAGELFMMFLAGDILLSAPPEDREHLLREMEETIGRTGRLSERRLLHWAKSLPDCRRDTLRIMAVGEPAIMYDDYLNGGTFARLEREGVHILYAPLSEYLHFLWRDQADFKPRAEFEHSMSAVAAALAGRSGFSANPGHLREMADRRLPVFAGANGRYRCAKIMTPRHDVSGALSLSSLHENTATIIGMLETPESGIPLLELAFDGNPGYQDELRLASFLRRLAVRKITNAKDAKRYDPYSPPPCR